MRIKKDVVTQKLAFVAIDSADHITRKTGLSSFTVYYSLNGGAAAAMTTPTVAELDSTNMVGDYTLLVDEAGMVSAAGELILNITASGMDTVTRIVEIVTNLESDNNTLLLDIPTITEFNARTLASADYVVVGDTIAGVTLCTTCTTNTDMRGTNSAALASVCTEGRLAELDAANLITDVANVKTDTAAILIDTAVIGALGAGLTALSTQASVNAIKAETALIVADTNELQLNQGNWITATGFATPTNITAGTITTVTNLTNAPTVGDLTAAMKLSVNAECDTALIDYDSPTNTEMVAAFTQIKGATWAATDSLEAIRDRGDAAWVTGTGSAADVWSYATRQLTGTQTFNLTGNVTGNLSGSVGTLTGHTVQTGDSYALVNNGTYGLSALDTDLNALLTRLPAALTEPTQGAPSATPAPMDALAYLYMFLRNKRTTTAVLDTIYADNGTTAVMKATIGDDGTTFSKAEYLSGA